MEYPELSIPSPGKWTEITDGLLWLRMPLPFDLDHINLYLIEDNDGWVVIDTGLASSTTKDLWTAIFSALDKPICGVIVTHLHPDHVGLAGWIAEEFKVPLYMSQLEYFTARALSEKAPGRSNWRDEEYFKRAGLATEQIDVLLSGNKGFGSVVSPLPLSYTRLKQNDVLSFKGREWRVMIGKGHSPEHVCLHCQELGVLLAGDHILPMITPNIGVYTTEPEGNTLQDYLATLVPFTELPSDTLILPAHKQPFIGVQARVDELISHHHRHLAALNEACEQPRSLVSLLPIMFKRELNGRNIMFAVAECLSHLNYLRFSNKLIRTLSDSGVYLYQSRHR
ncbi:MBL fold metallo-hydrolase [Alteromonas sp. 345S023]|uniref:MBL fold metallo-hydrolase n=1 Tax=Alteromonas profundi TaxID=2696062 RepID=A0A7X5LN03_9ALTE|nr:MBL fold metallo-hydrolase [Alteromonas profundi]NDV92378.1 MBL fold metallo-hydrolase [Alteromonas profundi]